jgi:hypothetical protein
MSGIEQFIARTRCARRTDRRVKLVDEILSVLTAGHKHIFTLAYHNMPEAALRQFMYHP